MSGHLARGAAAEEFAARALRRAGYRVLLRNVRTPVGELDIVAQRRGVYSFIEVKARRPNGSTGAADGALTPTKLRRVARAADHVLQRRGLADAPRELLGAAVDLDAGGNPIAVRFLPVEEIR